jgi:hypothetical protein
MGAEHERVAGFGKLEDGLRQAADWYRWGPRTVATTGSARYR